MTHEAAYRWSLDWGDDDYANPYAAIPTGHITTYRAVWGSNLEPTSSAVGVATADGGHITLLDPNGRYWRHGDLTRDALSRPHRWKLEIEGELQCRGRAYPIFGSPMGSVVQPVTWELAGDGLTELNSYGELVGHVGTTASVLGGMRVRGGPVVISTQYLRFTRGVTFRGPWTNLISILATLTGGWAVRVGRGHIHIITPYDIDLTDPVVTVDASHGIGANMSGLGTAAGLVRTDYVLHNLYGLDIEIPILGRDEATYGRRVINVPDWFTPSDTPNLALIFRRLAQAPVIVQLALEDEYATQAIANQITSGVVSGHIIAAVIPSPDGDVHSKFAVLRTELTGGHGLKPQRLIRGVALPGALTAVGADADPDPRPGPIPDNAPPAPTLTLIDPQTVRVEWPATYDPLEVERTLSGHPAQIMPVVVALTTDTPHDDTPPTGYYDYRLGEPGRAGPWGPWVGPIGVVTLAAPPAPTLAAVNYGVSVSWPPTANLGPVDIARAPNGDRSNPVIIATDIDAITYYNDLPGVGLWDYRLRAGGLWGEWAGPAVVFAPLPPPVRYGRWFYWATGAYQDAWPGQQLPFYDGGGVDNRLWRNTIGSSNAAGARSVHVFFADGVIQVFRARDNLPFELPMASFVLVWGNLSGGVPDETHYHVVNAVTRILETPIHYGDRLDPPHPDQASLDGLEFLGIREIL